MRTEEALSVHLQFSQSFVILAKKIIRLQSKFRRPRNSLLWSDFI